MNAKQTAFLAAHAAALPAAVTAPGLSAMIEALPHGRTKALADHETHATLFDGEGRAIATLSRPRVIGADKLYYLALSDGRTVAAFHSCPTVKRCLEAVYSYATSRLPADSDPGEELDSYRASFVDNWTQAEAGIYLNFRAAALTHCARWARRIALAEVAAAAEELDRQNFGPARIAAFYEALESEELGEEEAPAPRAMAERAGLGDAIRRGMAPDVTPAPFFGYPLAPTRAAPAPLWPVQPRRAFAGLARVMGGR